MQSFLIKRAGFGVLSQLFVNISQPVQRITGTPRVSLLSEQLYAFFELGYARSLIYFQPSEIISRPTDIITKPT